MSRADLSCGDCLLYKSPPEDRPKPPALRWHGWCLYHCAYVHANERMPDHCREKQGLGGRGGTNGTT